MFSTFKALSMKAKKAVVTGSLVIGSAFAVVAPAFAADPATPAIDTSGVNSTFATITTTILLVIGTVALSAVAIMGTLLAWKYGRKLFSMIAK